MNTLMEMQKMLDGRVVENKDISHFLTLKTKTNAQYYIAVFSKEDFLRAVLAAQAAHISYFVLGGGSNLAAVHDTISGLVIHNKYIKKEIVEETDEYTDIMFSAGYPMSRVVKETIERGLSGFEYHLGLPGTIGGAIYMNSKWTKPVSYCGDMLAYAFIVDTKGNERKVDRDYFKFAYDYSVLQETKEVVLDAVFRLKKEDHNILKERSEQALAYRRETQPYGVHTGGCFFQNISEEQQLKANVPSRSAGYLIDTAGLKGIQVGTYVVSDKHANFIINTGEGKPEDLQKLLQRIKSTVKEKYGVVLMEEVIVI